MVFTGIQLIQEMETFAPNQYAEEWDNVGFLIGDPEKTIQKILVALDVTPEVVQEAIQYQVDIIITHHPFLFKPISSIREDDAQGKQILALIRNQIGVYAAHTNLDITFGGTNDVLASKLSLSPTEVLSPMVIGDIKDPNKLIGMGRIAELCSPVSVRSYAEHVRQCLGLKHIRVVGDLEQSVCKIALCTGSGMGYLRDAYRQGVDLFITGDVKYHEAQQALDWGLAVIDAGHYGTEILIVPVLAELIRKWTQNQVEVIESKTHGDPFQILEGGNKNE